MPTRRSVSLGVTPPSTPGTPKRVGSISSNASTATPGTPGTPTRRGSAANRASSATNLVFKSQPSATLAWTMPPVLKVSVGAGAFDSKVSVVVNGAKAEGSGLPDVCSTGKAFTATWASTTVCRGAATRGTLTVEGFGPVFFSVAHNDSGSTFIHSKGKWRHTMLSAPEWDWRAHANKPEEGKAADVEILSANYHEKAPTVKVQVRMATEIELKRFLQLRAMKEAEEEADYDTLHAQVSKAKLAGVERAEIERAEEKLKELRKQGLHVSEGADKETLKSMMQWSGITRSSLTRENQPCAASTDCPCNEEMNCGEVLEVVPNSVQECLAEFGPEGDRLLFDELAGAALAVQEGSVWKAGGKFIFSAFDRNQSVTALTRMLHSNGRKLAAKMLLQMVKFSEKRYTGYVTSIQVNFHPHGGTYHAQHRDIYSAKQRAGPNCTCSFRKCVGTVCYTVGSSRVCALESCTDSLSALSACCDECQGRKENVWLHSGDAMFFNEAWNANHTHGIPSMEEVEPGKPCGPRISVAFLLGAEEERNSLYQH